MIEVESKTRDIPVWLTGIVLILCIAGGIWMVRWYTHDAGPRTVVVPLEDSATVSAAAKFRNPSNGNAPANPNAEGVRSSGNRKDAWVVRAADATMYVSRNRAGQFDLSPAYVHQALTPEQAQVLMMRRRLLMDASAREQIKLTEQQLDALRKVEDFRGMIVTPIDKVNLANLFKAWHDSGGDKAAEEKALVAALADVAKRSAEPTRAFDASRVEQVRKILTAEQVKQLNQGLTPPNGTPSQPAPATPNKAPARTAASGAP
jgi:hypothetical protein